MRKVFIIGLIILSTLAIGCDKKENKDNQVSNEITEQVFDIEPIGCYRFKDDKTGLYGYIDGDGKVIIEPKYKYATDFQYLLNDYAQAYDENDTVTIIDKAGKEYLPFGEYKLVALPQNELIIFQNEEGKCGVVNLDGKKILEPIYDYIEIDLEGAIIVSLGNKKGAFDKNGNAILDIEYNYILQVKDSLIVDKDDKYGLFNLKGEEVISTIYKEVQIAHSVGKYEWEVFYVVNNEEKIAFFDNKGKQLTDFLYDEVKPGRDELIPVLKDGKWGYINLKGEIAIPFDFDSASSFSDEEAEVGLQGEKKIINTKGEFIENENPSYVKDGEKYSIIEEENKYKLVNGNGKIISDNNYSSMYFYYDSVIAVNEEKYFILDLKGNILAECKFLIPIGLNLFVASEVEAAIEGKIIDYKGNIISDDIYVEADGYDMFSKIVAKKIDGNYVVLNEKGEKLLDIESGADNVEVFEDDLIRVEFSEDKFKWINTKGDVLP